MKQSLLFSLLIISLLKPFTAGAQEDVQLFQHPTLGTILTDAAGFTLYFYTLDIKRDSSSCYDDCLVAWPEFYVENPTVAGGLLLEDFATITREDGLLQTTYKGWPLYYYVGDMAPSHAYGEGIGEVWYVAKRDYSILYLDQQLVGPDGVEYTSDYEPGQGVTQFFVDDEGRTMYYNESSDIHDTNNFTLPDFSNDSIYSIVKGPLKSIPSNLDEDDFGTAYVFGQIQLTYRSWPLYFSGSDEEKGQTLGIFDAQAFRWPVMVKDPPFGPGVTKVVEGSSFQQLIVHPNPFTNNLTIQLETNSETQVQVSLFNGFGQLVFQEKRNLLSGANRLDLLLPELPTGLYFLEINTNQESVATMKLLRN